MEFEKLKVEATKHTLLTALETLKENKSHGYIWLGFRSKAGLLMEVGGRFYNDLFEFKFEIPTFFQGQYEIHANGYVRYGLSFNNLGVKTYPNKNLSHSLNEEELISFIDNTDFRTWVDKDPSLTMPAVCGCCGQ